ncbi:MAG: twin-arginine translocase subunit TatC [Micrococcales bacterium]
MSLRGHLGELRKRLLWSAFFFLVASTAGWFLFDPVFAALQQPVVDLAKQKGIDATINFNSVVSAFDLRMQLAMFIGFIISSPFWLFNLWAFITPGLKKHERRYSLGFLFAAVPLFLSGCYVAWAMLPAFVKALLAFTPAGSANIISASDYILFSIRILLVFGLSFVLPVVLVLLNFIGLIDAKAIRKGWRLAIFLSALLSAMATPTGDPMSMFLLMVPMVALFYLAVAVATIRDRFTRKRSLADANTTDVASDSETV